MHVFFPGHINGIYVVSLPLEQWNQLTNGRVESKCIYYQIADARTISIEIMQDGNSCETKKSYQSLAVGGILSFNKDQLGSCKTLQVNVNLFQLDFKVKTNVTPRNDCPIQLEFEFNNTHFRSDIEYTKSELNYIHTAHRVKGK